MVKGLTRIHNLIESSTRKTGSINFGEKNYELSPGSAGNQKPESAIVIGDLGQPVIGDLVSQ